MNIRKMTDSDFEAFWPVFHEIVKDQETYAFDPEISYQSALDVWVNSPAATYVATENDVILGSYYVKKNAAGPGSHICNCGYMVNPLARGKGVAKTLCIHSQKVAAKLGFLAMQFNSVVSTNTVAVNLWKKLGYQVIGTIPKAYQHKQQGLVDAFIMYKKLNSE
jgi:ribosomal protein S18 acetylase RimI-like enzyme